MRIIFFIKEKYVPKLSMIYAVSSSGYESYGKSVYFQNKSIEGSQYIFGICRRRRWDRSFL